MRNIWFDANGRLRNGWWMLIFIGLIAVTRAIYGPLNDLVDQTGIDALKEALPPLLVLAATWICVRLRRESLGSVGLALGRRQAVEFAAGFAVSLTMIALMVALVWLSNGATLELNPDRQLAALGSALVVFLLAVTMEELLFRGFLFQRLIAGASFWIAQLVFAALFALGHWTNPELEGTARWWGTLDIALGSLVFGLAYWRTGNLALPIGLHLGWNWAQGALFGFSVSGHAHASWLTPVLLDQPDWITGGGFGLEASVFASLLDALLLVCLWRWSGTTDRAGADVAQQPGRHDPADQSPMHSRA